MLSTATKIVVARIAYSGVMLFRKLTGASHLAQVSRGGVTWDLDLREGIDFSIYLLGGFEPRTLKLYEQLVKPGDVVLDIGANIGAHALPLARLVGPNGRVIAFEPTRFAFQKLKKNVVLNPDLEARITANQQMLVQDLQTAVSPSLFSSWPLVEAGEVHDKHKGRLMDTTGCVATTLDQAVAAAGITSLALIKLDVDGNEPYVLMGGERTLERFRPVVLMELAPYLFDSDPGSFDTLMKLFEKYGYTGTDADSGKQYPIQAARLRATFPDGTSRNVLLTPAAR